MEQPRERAHSSAFMPLSRSLKGDTGSAFQGQDGGRLNEALFGCNEQCCQAAAVDMIDVQTQATEGLDEDLDGCVIANHGTVDERRVACNDIVNQTPSGPFRCLKHSII